MGNRLAADPPDSTAAPTAAAQPSAANTGLPERRALAILALLMLFATALRLYRLTALGLWGDEGWSAQVAQMSLPRLLRWCGGDTSPPLYYIVLHAFSVFGRGDAVLRMPSVIFGVLSIPAIYLCGRAAYSSRAGLIAAALLTVNTFHVRYSQEARFYSLYLFVTLWAVYFTLELARRPSWGRWLGWVTAGTALLYIHSTAAVYVMALTPLLGALRRQFGVPCWGAWIAAHLGIAALFLPWSTVQAQQMARVVHDFWPPTPTLATLGITAVQMFSIPFIGHEAGQVDLPVAAALLALPYGVGLAGIPALRRRDPRASAATGLLCFALTGWALIFVFSVAVRSIYIVRVLIPTMGGLILVVAIALAHAERFGRVVVARAVLALMLLSGGLSLGLYFRHFRKEDIRGAARFVRQHAGENEAFACVEHGFRPAIEHYLKGGPLLPSPFHLSQFTQPGNTETDATRADLAADLRTFSSFWLVEAAHPDSRVVNQLTEQWLKSVMEPVEARSFYCVRVVHYKPRAQAASTR